MNLVVVGSVAVDSVETPFGREERALGGAATYASVAASYFAQPGIVGVVGKDFERRHINLLRRRGVDLEGLQTDPSGDTFHWAGRYEGEMNQAQTLDTRLNVFERFAPRLPEAWRDTPHVLLGNIVPTLQLDVLDQARAPRLTLCDTMNFWITSMPAELEKVFRRVDIVCINDAEARQFTGKATLPAAAAELLKLGPRRIIIKKGSNGVAIFGPDSFFALPALPLRTVKDPTGAGDSFAGGFMGQIARSRKLDDNAFRRALMAGTILASFCVEDFSCRRTASLKSEDIQTRAAWLRDITRLPDFRV